jgi:hypothetical protein
MDLTKDEKAILLQIISQSRFTPNEWEVSVKPIVLKLQEEQNGNAI